MTIPWLLLADGSMEPWNQLLSSLNLAVVPAATQGLLLSLTVQSGIKSEWKYFGNHASENENWK